MYFSDIMAWLSLMVVRVNESSKSLIYASQVMGEVRKSTKNDESYFSWSHSYSRVFQHLKETKYDPAGSFMQFAGFDVENRPRVKCVTASRGNYIVRGM